MGHKVGHVEMDLLKDKLVQLRVQGHFRGDGALPVASPCVGVCRLTPDRLYCSGCLRTLDEIRVWSSASAVVHRHILEQVWVRAGMPDADIDTGEVEVVPVS